MELAITSNTPDDCLKLTTSESANQPNTIPVLRAEGISVLASENATSVISDASGTQFFNLPILQDGSVPHLDTQQSYILATSADGNTILVEASQLAMLSDQSIPLYDGSNLFQLGTTQAVLDTSLNFNKTSYETVEETGDTVENGAVSQKRTVFQQFEEILPPDRKGRYKCKICEVEFNQEKQMLRHFFRVHGEDKPHQCSECDVSFNKKSNLILHEATHNKSDPTCPECHKKFTRLASLKSHLMLHETEENLTCAECGDEFSTQLKLDKHMQVHLTEQAMDQTFVCRFCSKGYRKLSYLKEHMKIHYKLKISLHRRQYKRNIDRSTFSHKCFFCGKQFQKPSQLIRHNRIHTGERPFKCDMCDRAFNQKGALLIHKIRHTGERPYICEFCPAAFAQKGNLRNHIRRVHSLMTMEGSEGIHKCELCSCVFRKLGSLNAHMSRTHSTSSISFIELSKSEDDLNSQDVSSVMSQLMEMSKDNGGNLNKENIEKIAMDGNVNADILQQALENSGLATNEQSPGSKPCVMTVADSATGTLRRHIMRNIGGVRWYQCVYCTKEFKKPSDLVRHIRIHTHEKPYKCGQCYRAFAVKSTLNAHIRTHTGAKDFSCEHCKKLFSTSGSLKVHLLLHTGAKPFSCTLCSKTFRTSGHRNSHLASHQNQKDKATKRARRCAKASNVSDINVANIPLQEPILITDEGYVQPVPKNSVMYTQFVEQKFPSERPYRCDICQKGFKKSSHLKQHIRSHTGEKPYKCYQCERSFVSNGVLKAHVRTHTGMKSFNCHICETSFTTNGSLKRHMCIHSNDRPYMCPYCQKTFKTSMNCKKHMNTHRYELALGMASGVAVTVISDGVGGAQTQENSEKQVVTADDVQDTISEIVESGEGYINCKVRTVITLPDSFNSDPATGVPSSEVLTHIPQHLSQEVFNAQTGMIEQAEIVPQSQVFEQAPNNIFALSESDFPGNQLTLQSDPTNDYVSANSPSADITVSDASNILPQEECVVETTPRKEDSTKAKENKKRVKTFKRPFKCPECSKIFKKSSHLKQHIQTHSGEKPFRCKTCGDAFGHLRVLQDHIKAKHENLREFKCQVCTSAFAAKASLQRHMAIHDINQPFHCAYCTEKFTTKELYKQHLKDYHPSAICREETVSEVATIQIPEVAVEQAVGVVNLPDSILLQSMTDKDEDKNDFLPRHAHLCPQCSKSFKKPSDLVRHMRIHTGERPYKCESCGKAFTVKSTLDSHQKTHTGEKNFSCHVCTSLFATKGSLKVHMRLHTGVRPFKCPHCELHFRTSGHRKSHMASHFKESSSRKHKKSRSSETQVFVKDVIQQMDALPVVSLAEEVINVVQPTDIQVPSISQATIQVQPSNLVNSNIQLTTIDPSLMSKPKPIQIDASLIQQLQQHFNLNITINPGITEQLNNKNLGDANPTQILNIEGPVNTTINPNMILHQLGFTFNLQPQSEIPSAENVTLIIPETNLAKNGNEVYHTTELFDSQILTMESSTNRDAELVNAAKSTEQEVFLTNSDATHFTEIESTLNEVTCELSHECPVCEKVFKTTAQLNRHSKTHREKTKNIYHCETCTRDFKKKASFLKHLQTHQ